MQAELDVLEAGGEAAGQGEDPFGLFEQTGVPYERSDLVDWREGERLHVRKRIYPAFMNFTVYCCT
jgi:hypothetical protein